MLTGAPTERFEPDDETVFERLCKGEKCGWPMMASTSTSKDIDAEKLVGLVEGHAYAILNAKLVLHLPTLAHFSWRIASQPLYSSPACRHPLTMSVVMLVSSTLCARVISFHPSSP